MLGLKSRQSGPGYQVLQNLKVEISRIGTTHSAPLKRFCPEKGLPVNLFGPNLPTSEGETKHRFFPLTK